MKWKLSMVLFTVALIATVFTQPDFPPGDDEDDSISVEAGAAEKAAAMDGGGGGSGGVGRGGGGGSAEAIYDPLTDEFVEPDEDDIAYESPKITGRHYFAETFDDPKEFEKKWIKSEAIKEDMDADIAKYDGVWSVEAPAREKLKGDLGLVLKSKAKHAAISAKLNHPFEFDEKPFIVQYEVTLQDGQECGGAYLKLLTHGRGSDNLKQFQDKTPYTIMFGPDKCGGDHKLHFIFRHQNPKNFSFSEKHCKKPKERLEEAFSDKLPHLYTLILFPDNAFEIRLDHKVVNEGSLLEDFTPPVNPPAEIDDPNDVKPKEWDDREKIPDPDAIKPDDWNEDAPKQIIDTSAVKPEGWLDDESTLIPDPNAVRPDDWDTEMDGDWEPPLIANPVCTTAPGCGEWKPPKIDNPEYKGKWRAPLIDNPNYKGKWKAKRIPNPDHFYVSDPFKMTSIGAVGFEIWSMSPNILFDNIIITDDLGVAEMFAGKTFDLKRKKIDKDSVSLWQRFLKITNYRPGWWGIYGTYCAIPVIIYIWYLRKRYIEESMWTRVLRYTQDNPWIWAVYVLAIGLPLVLILFFCCGGTSSTKDKEEIGSSKKTDALSPDDIIEEAEEEEDELAEGDVEKSPKPSTSKSSLDVPEESERPEEASGDAPGRRKVRKD